GLSDLLAVLVGARQEVDVLAQQPVPSGDGITDDGGVRVAEMRLGGDVIDGCGEEVVAHDGILSKNGERTADQKPVRIRRIRVGVVTLPRIRRVAAVAATELPTPARSPSSRRRVY